MNQSERLPRPPLIPAIQSNQLLDLLTLLGPGAIMASMTIGNGGIVVARAPSLLLLTTP